MEQQFLLVYFSDYDDENGARGTPIVEQLTRQEILDKTKTWSQYDYAVFYGVCIKDFNTPISQAKVDLSILQ